MIQADGMARGLGYALCLLDDGALARLAGFGLVERCVDGQPRQHAACRPHLLGIGSHPVPEASCALEADLHRTIANGRLCSGGRPTTGAPGSCAA